MSLQRKTAEVFQLLGLEQLPEECVTRLWEHNFCESVSLPPQVLEGVVSVQTWQSVVAVCREWLAASREPREDDNQDKTGGGGFWSTLLDHGVPHKSLLALIFCLLDRNEETVVDIECSVLAAQTYLLLLRIPGSTTFKIYQPIILQKTLKMFFLLSGEDGSDREGGEGSKRARRRGGRRGGRRRGGGGRERGKRGKRRRQEEGVGSEEESVMEESSLEVLSQSRESERRNLVSQLAVDLLQFTESYSLLEEAARYQLVQAALHLVTRHTTSTTLTTDMISESGVSSPVSVEVVAWKTLLALSLNQDVQAKTIISEVFIQLIPTLLMLSSDGRAHSSSTSLPLSLTAPSNNAITFICHLVAVRGDVVLVPLKGLVQHMCTKTPDRAEYRSKMATSVCKLLTLFPDQLYSQLLEWLYRLSMNEKISWRVSSLEVISELLTHPLRQAEKGSLSGEEEYRLSCKYLVETALSRCLDKAPTVRVRALSCLAAAASSTRPEVISTVVKCLSSQMPADPLVAGKKNVRGLIIPMVRRRTRDLKVGVRKVALQALEALIRLDMTNINREDVLAIHERCMDPAVSVRKLAMVSLTSLITDLPQSAILIELWLDGVLPMVMDKETSAQEKCISILEAIILSNIAPLTDDHSSKQKFVWDLLSLVADQDRSDLRRYLRRAIEQWSKQGKLTAPLVRALCSHTADSTHEKAVWSLLCEMSPYIASLLDRKFVLDNWKVHSSVVSMETTAPLVQILLVVGNMAKTLGRAALGKIRDEVVHILNTFQFSPAVMQAAITALCRICESLTSPDDYQSAIDSWCVPLLKKCEKYFSALIDDPAGSGGRDIDEREGSCYLFATGELCQLSPVQTPSHLSLMVHSLLLATGEGEEESFRASQSSQLSRLSSVSLSPYLRALGYITLGKLCLQNDDLTKKAIPQMIHELQTSTHAATRNNVVVVLCDLAVRYTVKVDPHIPAIAMCLKDESLLVRRQTLTLLANLIQEDYIKWKGSLFYRFISTLLDEELRAFAEFCLVHLLLARHPNMFFQHFIECVFHFNGYEKHRVYNRFKQTEKEKTLFSLKGNKYRGQRMKLYTFLLSHMTDPHRFQLLGKLCQEVLGGVVDKTIPLNESSIPVIQDALAILTSKEIKLTSLRRNVGEELADEGDHEGAIAAFAQTKIITQIVKMDVIENFIPTVIAAKHLFEKEHSPLLKDLLLCLKEIMQDFRSEVNEILAAERQLAEEIEFDLKRVEEEQRKAAKATPTPLAATPRAQMVSPLLSPCVLGTPGSGRTVLTPPRLRTPTGKTGTAKTGTAKTPRITALNLPLPRIMSPLVINRQRVPLPSDQAAAVVTTPQRRLDAGDVAEEHGGVREDVTTPAAARARASLVNSSYVPEVMNPLFRKTPRIPLQRAVLSTAQAARHTPKRTRVLNTEDTVLHGGHGRVASTPEGLAESISFNVSTVVPPSPIPPNTNTDCYLSKTRLRSRRPATGKTADIMMLPPDKEPRKLDKWRVK